MPSNKKTAYFAEAERLFIVENYTLEDIANKLPVTTRTLIDWKKEGDWDRKRRELAKQKEAFHVELYEFSRILLRKVRTDMEAGKDASSGQLYALTNLLGIVGKVKDYEDKTAAEKPKDSTSQADKKTKLEQVISEILGV